MRAREQLGRVVKERIWNLDGTRKCSWCDNTIINCNGFVLAGDFLLALRGQIPPKDIRERCGSCMAHYTICRDGTLGPYVWLVAKICDACRYITWKLQYNFLPQKYPPMWPV